MRDLSIHLTIYFMWCRNAMRFEAYLVCLTQWSFSHLMGCYKWSGILHFSYLPLSSMDRRGIRSFQGLQVKTKDKVFGQFADDEIERSDRHQEVQKMSSPGN